MDHIKTVCLIILLPWDQKATLYNSQLWVLYFPWLFWFFGFSWCWRRLLRVPWTARRSKQSILKEISPGCSLEGIMLKLKLQYFGHLMQRTDSLERPWCWERLKAGGEGYDRGWDGWMASPTQWMWVWVNSGSWWWTGRPGMLQFMVSQRVGHDWVTELNWKPDAVFSILDSLKSFKNMILTCLLLKILE